MKRYLLLVMVLAGMLPLASCGGGGGSTTAPNVVRGVASKGIIKNGTVRVFAVNADGSKGQLLKETSTDGNGAYSADLGSYTGAVILEASGSYTDEATGTLKTVTADAPLRAALRQVSGQVTVAVTPLTELAVQKGEDPTSHRLTLSQIAANNAAVSALFQVDIVGTLPVDALAASPNATQGEKEYALVLAGFSQLMQTKGEALPALLAELKGGIGSGDRMAAPLLTEVRDALTAFSASAANQTGIGDVSATGLINMGGGTRPLSIALSGTSALVSAVDIKITLPAGVTVKSDVDGNVPAGVLKLANGAVQNALTAGVVTPATPGTPGTVRLALLSATGFPAGALLTLQCDVAASAQPAAGDFTTQLLQAYDTRQAPLAGLSISLALN